MESNVDEIFRVMAHPVRRHLLCRAVECDVDAADVDTVTEWVAGKNGTRERMQIALRHTHLPKLRDAELVRYADGAGEVRFREPPPLVADICRILNTRRNAV